VNCRTHRCMGSHAREVTHFECPLRGSPIGLPVLGSQSLTYAIEVRQKTGEGTRTIKYGKQGSRSEHLIRGGIAGSKQPSEARVMSGTHMSIVSPRGEFSLHSLPFDAEHPTFVTRQQMGRSFGEQIPQPGVAIAGTGREEVPSRGE